MDNRLHHSGVKGMKWGVRRYQNKDGTLTPAGKKRYDRDVRENNSKKKDNRIVIEGPDVNRWAREDLDRARKATNSASDTVRDIQKLDRTLSKKNKTRMDLSEMSDQEMRSRINRELLERQYSDMFAPQKTAKGHDYAMRTLEVAGDVLAVSASALGIALAIKELKG